MLPLVEKDDGKNVFSDMLMLTNPLLIGLLLRGIKLGGTSGKTTIVLGVLRI